MDQNIDITKLDVTQLKAIGYDLVIQLQSIQNNLNLISAELNKRYAAQSQAQSTPVDAVIPRV